MIKKEILKFLLRQLNKWYVKIINDDENHSREFQVLTPTDDAKKIGKYTIQLQEALEYDKVKNIAITGSFGAGKSSFLRTFEKHNQQWEYLNISLATFKDEEIRKQAESETFDQCTAEETSTLDQSTKEDTSTEKHPNKIENRNIEESILQQIFYKVKDNKLSNSKFNRIRKAPKKKAIIIAFIIVFIISMTLLKFYPEQANKLFSQLLFILSAYKSFKNFLEIVYLSSLSYLIFLTIRAALNYRIEKINLKGQLELAKSKSKSVFNDNLDEIFNFFENTNYNVIIFEDLDRFKSHEIFIKLRELNKLLNNSNQIKRTIKFIYAIKDDMFKSKNRTKFFDVIIPIIPYINPSNSESKFLELFEKDISGSELSSEFLCDVSLFIDDMRLLKNIYNEYVIYKSFVCSSQSDKNKLLAIIIYKNCYPDDFALLNVNKGKIYELFNNKKIYIKKQKHLIKLENLKLQEGIDTKRKDLEKDKDKNIKELRYIYVTKIFELLDMNNHNTVLIINNKQYRSHQIQELVTDSVFETIQTANSIRSNYSSRYFTFNQIEKKVNSIYTYRQRLNNIISRPINAILGIEQTIKKNKERLTNFSSFTLKDIVENNSNEIIDSELKQNKLVWFLIIRGYIDENYYDYISHFFEGVISTKDREFLASVKSNNALQHDYELDSCKQVIKKIHLHEFRNQSILNHDLINFLIINRDKTEYNDKYKVFLDNLSSSESESFKPDQITRNFIYQHLLLDSDIEQFIIDLSQKWHCIWVLIENNKELSSKEKQKLFFILLDHLETSHIKIINQDDCFKTYLEHISDISLFDETLNVKYESVFNELDIKFLRVDNPKENLDLFNKIINNKSYRININMIEAIFLSEETSFSKKIKLLKTANLTTINQFNNTKLLNYIFENINTYLESVFLFLESNTNESKDVVVDLLNNTEIDSINKREILKKQKHLEFDLHFIKDQKLWDEIIRLRSLDISWKNLLTYQTEKEDLSDTVIDFLNEEDVYKKLSETILTKLEGINEHKLDNLILKSNKINDDSYQYLIKSIHYTKYELDISGLSNEKIRILVETNKIAYSQESYDMIEELDEEFALMFLENFMNYFSRENDDLEVESSMITKLLYSEKLLSTPPYIGQL